MASTVTVKILGDTTRLKKATDEAEGAVGGMGKKFAGVAAGIAGAFAGAKLLDFGKQSVQAFKESEQSAARLQDAFARFPALSDSNLASFQKLNEQLAKKTRFDDDATASGQAVLAQFGLTGKQIEAMTPLLQDYAAKTGKDLPSAAEDLGKAMLGQGKALKAIGIEFKDTGSASGNFEELMGGLRTQVGGFATKEGQTAAGKAEILKNQMGELQETVGSKLVPAMTKLTDVGLRVVSFFTGLGPNVQKAIGVVVALGGAVFLASKAMNAAKAVQEVWAMRTKVWAAAQAVWNAVMMANPIFLIGAALIALGVAFYLAYKKSETFRDIVDAVLHAVADAGKWVWESALKPAFEGIVAGFEAVGNAVGWVWNNLIKPPFDMWAAAVGFVWRNVIGPAFDGIATAVRTGVAVFSWAYDNLIKPAFNAWKGGIDWIIGVIQGIAGFVGSAFQAAANAAKAPLNVLIGLINGVLGGIEAVAHGMGRIPGAPDFLDHLNLPRIPQLADGGIVRARPGGMLALLGEGGRDEAVVPLGRGGGVSGGGDIYVQIDVHGSVVTEGQLVNTVLKGIEQQLANGRRMSAGPGKYVLTGR